MRKRPAWKPNTPNTHRRNSPIIDGLRSRKIKTINALELHIKANDELQECLEKKNAKRNDCESKTELTMKKLIYVLLAAACFVCAELKADDKPQDVVTKIERKHNNEGELWLIRFSYEKEGELIGWLEIRRGNGKDLADKNGAYLRWMGLWPVLINWDKEFPKFEIIHGWNDELVNGKRRPSYAFRPPRNGFTSFPQFFLWKLDVWDKKLLIGFQLVQDAKEND